MAPPMLALAMLTLSSLASPTSPASAAHAGALALDVQNLQAVGSVLYVAAHPDDENTRLLAWLAGRGLRAGYLSITRGDGGQNLIGTEQGELLGLIRTHELLAARGIDGAEQMFTRARDFGYSKSAEETLAIWGKEDVLGDVVLAVRRFRPDVIITRFSTEPPNHGHHTASALLAAEAFTAAADPTRFPEQLRPVAQGGAGVTTWQADRLLHNESTWRLKPGPETEAMIARSIALDVGGYEPLLGASWGELSAASRSMHKSQGFGVAAERGPLLEYFKPLARAPGRAALTNVGQASGKRGPLEGLALDWSRVHGAADVARAVDAAAQGFDARKPHASIGALLAVHAALAKLPLATDPDAISTRHWRDRKRADVERLLVACAGLHLDARAPTYGAVPNSALAVDVSALLRAPLAADGAHSVKLVGATLGVAGATGAFVPGAALAPHAPWKAKANVIVPAEASISTPYWLAGLPGERAGGRYPAPSLELTGVPVDDAPLTARFRVTFAAPTGGATFEVERAVQHVWVDPVRGELARDVEIVPEVTATFAQDVVMLPNGGAVDVSVVLAAAPAAGDEATKVSGTLRLAAPPGFVVSPAAVPFTLARGEARTATVRVTPPRAKEARVAGPLQAVLGDDLAWSLQSVRHEHLPPLDVRAPAEVKLVPLDIKLGGKRIGYLPGPGDKVAEALAAVGYDVTRLPLERLARTTLAELARFDAIVVGVRAFNAEPRLVEQKEKLLSYVERGGTLVAQYNTASRVGPLVAAPWPYPLELSRDRVTDERAKVTRLNPKDAMWSKPNVIGDGDFEGWVQERGLYFASTWDPAYTPAVSMQDPGEKPSEGALLVARRGKGTFIYTGLAFFRQLPAGVPGAYRLFANLVAR